MAALLVLNGALIHAGHCNSALVTIKHLFFTARGLLTQGPDAGSSDIYNYQYNITSRQLLAESKLLFNWHERYHPYALMGLGEAFNKASSYQTTSYLF